LLNFVTSPDLKGSFRFLVEPVEMLLGFEADISR
jgi:hypothetical protein